MHRIWPASCLPAAEEAPAPAKKPGFSFPGFGAPKSSRQAAPAVEEAEEEEEEAPAPAKRGAFRFGSSSSKKQQQAAAAAEEEEEAPAPAPRGRVVRGRAPVAAAAVEERPATQAQPKQEAAAEGSAPAKKQGGFLGFLGIQQETVYADE